MITLAGRMADAAGAITRRYFKSGLGVDHKADNSPVTLADREVETALRALIESTYPDHGIVGEEFGNVRADSPWQWVIDPIDGTRAFIAGLPTFTTLIALARNGVPLLGVIDNPITRERWLGIAGHATVCNAKTVTTRNPAALAQAIIGTTSAPDYFNAQEAKAFDRLSSACTQTLIGGDGYGYAQLASGRIDLFMDACLKPYDFCALRPVIEGAGGVITDWDGKPLTLASDGRVLAAGSKPLHQQALEILYGR